MITVKPFTIEVLSTHKGFFLLDKLPKHKTEVDVWVQTPTGNESVNFVDVFSMADGSLLAAWVHPFQKLPLHNLQVFCEGVMQVLNLYTIERIFEIYDRPSNAEYGTFIFCASNPIPNGDWRCDQSMYGPRPFKGEQVQRVIETVDELVFYEPFLNVNGIGHIIYIETRSKSELANEKLNNSIVPVTGRTIQECLRLIYEWSVLATEPFKSSDEASMAALRFVESLGFTQTEMQILENLTPMQVSKFIAGSKTARLRDMYIPSLSKEVSDVLFKRMGASTLSFIVDMNPAIWDFNEVLEEEWNQLFNGVARFREYYQIPASVTLEEENSIYDHAFVYFPKQLDYVKTQIRGFKNKIKILSSLDKGNETRD